MGFNFPKLPPSKTYSTDLTPETIVQIKLVQGQPITKEEEQILIEAIEFYKESFAILKSIDLSTITDEEAEEIKSFLKQLITMNLTILTIHIPTAI